MIDHLLDEHGELIVQVGDEVENSDARFFVGTINQSQRLCSIDKSRPYSLLNDASPMAPCIRQGNYSASASTLRRV